MYEFVGRLKAFDMAISINMEEILTTKGTKLYFQFKLFYSYFE